MIILRENQLIISIHDTEPKERRDWLIQAIAAAMRWSALANGNRTKKDDVNMIVLAELLEELIYVEINIGG